MGKRAKQCWQGSQLSPGQTASLFLLVRGRCLHCSGPHLVLFMGCHSGFSILFPSSLLLPKHKYTDRMQPPKHRKENLENVSRTFSRDGTTLQDCTYTGGTPRTTSVCSFPSYAYLCWVRKTYLESQTHFIYLFNNKPVVASWVISSTRARAGLILFTVPLCTAHRAFSKYLVNNK